jgi:hypothetical protein
VLLAAYAGGVVTVVAGVLVFESRWVVGTALALLAVISAFGYNAFRCPACRNSILQYSMRELRSWWRGPQACPFCEAELARIAADASPT